MLDPTLIDKQAPVPLGETKDVLANPVPTSEKAENLPWYRRDVPGTPECLQLLSVPKIYVPEQRGKNDKIAKEQVDQQRRIPHKFQKPPADPPH